jgi:hypothetical protein
MIKKRNTRTRRRPKQRKQNKSRRLKRGRKHSGGDSTSNQMKVVGKIYLNGCGPCGLLKEPWEDLTISLKGIVVFKDIEASNMDKELVELNNTYLSGNKQQVSLQEGFPTIYKIDKGKVSYYNGIRDMEPMKSWILN